MIREIKVKEVMVPVGDYPHIPYWFTIKQAMAMVYKYYEEAKEKGLVTYRTVLVFDEKYHFIGILTLKDLLKGVEPKISILEKDEAITWKEIFTEECKKEAEKPVSEIMTAAKTVVGIDDPIIKALHDMFKHNIDVLGVLEGGKVIGIVRLQDLFHVISKYIAF
jgi:CBS domain-containing protein